MLMLCIKFVQKPRTQKSLARIDIFANLSLKIHIFWDTTL